MRVTLFAIFISLFFIISCGDRHMPLPEQTKEMDEDKRNMLTVERIYTEVIVPKCLPCHSNGTGAGILDLSTADKTYNNMVGIMSKENPNMALVDPGKPAAKDSYLTAKIIEDPEFRLAQRMPFRGDPLSNEEIEMIKEWILGLEN